MVFYSVTFQLPIVAVAIIVVAVERMESMEYDPIAIMKTFYDTSYILHDDDDDDDQYSPLKLASSMTNEQLMDTTHIYYIIQKKEANNSNTAPKR